ncbi:sigma-70 family RNA polymerase sigma factor [Streptomyces sp. NPDC004667]|uniref:sigma-70 family RNA polymerase sigma factor n=1 Tax=Streptomyces sp. NPDC004667 TaxID=3154285 RepID=UPI0033BEE175
MSENPPQTAPPDIEGLLTDLRPRLLNAALYETGGDGHLSEDLVQIAMERIFQKLSQPDSSVPNNLPAYGRRIIKNTIVSEYRRKKPPVVFVPNEEIPDRHSPSGTSALSIVDSAGDEILRMVSELPKRQREVIVHCVLMNIDPESVAEKLFIGVDSVHRYYRAAIKSLQKKMITSSEEVSA